MKTHIKITCLVLLSVFTSCIGQAGVSNGGGGIGVRCLDAKGSTQSFELLDVYEARVRGQSLVTTPKSETEAVKLTVDLAMHQLYDPEINSTPIAELTAQANRYAEAVFEGKTLYWDDDHTLWIKVVFEPPLPLSADAGNYHIGPNCRLEQIAYYTDNDSVLHLSQDRWKELDWLSRGAVVLHESAYVINRENSLEELAHPNAPVTSEKTRAFVGQLLSKSGLVGRIESVPEGRSSACRGPGTDATSFYAFNESHGLTAVFNMIHAHLSEYQMKATFPGLKLNSLNKNDRHTIKVKADLSFIGEEDAPAYVVQIEKQPRQEAKFSLFQNENGALTPVLGEIEFACSPAKLIPWTPQPKTALHFPKPSEIPNRNPSAPCPNFTGRYVTDNTDFTPTVDFQQTACSELDTVTGNWSISRDVMRSDRWGREIAYWDGDTLVYFLEFYSPHALKRESIQKDPQGNLIISTELGGGWQGQAHYTRVAN